MDKIIKDDVKNKMLECVVSCQKNINRFNIHNMDSKIISSLYIDYYGKKTPLSKLSRIVVESSNSFRIFLFDYSIKNNVKKCIFLSKLDVNVVEDKNDLIIILPYLTEERKEKFLKLLKSEIELSKICIRNIRRKFKNKFKLMLKNKVISENDNMNLNLNLQKITNIYIKKLDIIFLNKKNR